MDNNEITIKLDNREEIRLVLNGTFPFTQSLDINPKISENDVETIVLNQFPNRKGKIQQSPELIIHIFKSKPILCFIVNLVTSSPMAQWQVFVDAQNGQIVEQVDRTKSCIYSPTVEMIPLNYFSGQKILKALSLKLSPESKAQNQDRKEVSENINTVNGKGWVYDPNPTFSAKKIYGDPGFVDGDDLNTSELEAELVTDIDLLEITEVGGVYTLEGPYAKPHIESPSTQSNTPNFFFTRDHQDFESVMCYYYIDKSIRYAYDELMFTPPTPTPGNPSVFGLPILYNSLSTGQGAFFEAGGTGDELLVFSAQGSFNVDYGEDASIIIHELGHAFHYWLTNGKESVVEGLSEGLSDYWSQSETRNCAILNTWNEDEDDYHKMLHWGGMPFAQSFQRFTNIDDLYPQSGWASHEMGQFMATALLKILSDIGKHKTDRLILESLPLLKEGISDPLTLRKAAGLIYKQAEIMVLNDELSENELCMIYNHLENVFEISAISDPNLQVNPPSGASEDLYIRDTHCDLGEETNPDNGSMWLSPDIWIRHNNDGGLEHENPEYNSLFPEYVNVRLRGIGCTELTGAELKVYFSKSSTGLEWPEKWENYQIPGQNGQQVIAGDLISVVSIPPVAAGEDFIITIQWYPPDPDDFLTDDHNFSLMARIVSSTDQMHSPEGLNVVTNARNNNNIALKSISIFDEEPDIGSTKSKPYGVPICGLDGDWLVVQTGDHTLDRSIFDYGNIYFELVEPFKTHWLNNGMQGTQFETQTDGTIKVLNENFSLSGFSMTNCEDMYVKFYFEPFPNTHECSFDIIHYRQDSTVVGGHRFTYKPDTSSQNRNFEQEIKFGLKDVEIQLFPNPSTEYLQVLFSDQIEEPLQMEILNLQGRLIKLYNFEKNISIEKTELNVGDLIGGMYFLRLSNKKSTFSKVFKFVKQ